MKKLIFKAADLLRVVDHSLAAPEQAKRFADFKDGQAIYAPVEAPAVLLVHDEGVYLMSNGSPRDTVGPDDADRMDETIEGRRSYVAYAQACNPKTDSGWYDTARDLVGGDDFGEALPWAAQIKAHIDAGAQEIIIIVKGDSLELTAPRARKQ